MTMNDTPVIGIIEWSGGDLEPDVFLGDSGEQVRAAVVERLWPMAEAGDINYVGAAWVAAHPKPDTADGAAVEQWLDALRAATTDAWLTIFQHGRETSSNRYADLRE
jgi:hypothetical protein